MSYLRCSVTSCAYNEVGKCCLNSIKVGGENAEVSHETECKSYQQKGIEASNYVPHGAPGTETYITCDAVKCGYNSDRVCQAESVAVAKCGSGEIGKCDCTQCDTYKPSK